MVVSVRSVRVIGGLVAALLAVPISPAALVLAAEAPEATQRRRGSRSRRTIQQRPSEYRRIPSRSAISRAELAVVLSVHFDTLLVRGASNHVVILTDTRDHWADRWIQTVARAGVLGPTPRHEFEPDRLLRRRNLAEAIAAVFDLAAGRDPTRAPRGRNQEPLFQDMTPAHVSYHAAATAVSSGVLDVARGGFFYPSAFVSGQEAMDVVRRLERLVRR